MILSVTLFVRDIPFISERLSKGTRQLNEIVIF